MQLILTRILRDYLSSFGFSCSIHCFMPIIPIGIQLLPANLTLVHRHFTDLELTSAGLSKPRASPAATAYVAAENSNAYAVTVSAKGKRIVKTGNTSSRI